MTNFKKGDRVKVFNLTLIGGKFYEGVAVVCGKAEEGGTFYNVRFVRDGFRCVRNLNNAEKIARKEVKKWTDY